MSAKRMADTIAASLLSCDHLFATDETVTLVACWDSVRGETTIFVSSGDPIEVGEVIIRSIAMAASGEQHPNVVNRQLGRPQ